MNKILYRGIRLRYDNSVEQLRKNGMKYYWNNPEFAISDIFSALSYFHKISQLGRNQMLRAYILEASRASRLQIWATEDKTNAESYARCTPELIWLTLRAVCIEKPKISKFLDTFYGKPHVVTFKTDEEHNGINLTIGTFIPPDKIINVEPVDLTKPDPYFQTLKGITA